MELEYEFEEVEVLGNGVLAWGEAALRSSSDAYPDEFYVHSIRFTNGSYVFRSDIAKKRGLLQELSMAELIFNVVAHKIETLPDAQEAWDNYRSEWDA